LKTYNNFIATRSFVANTIETKITAGFARSNQKTTLCALEVVFECHDFPELKVSDSIYVRSDMFVHQWAKEEVQVNGECVIMVPRSFVLGYSSKG
jgi:hypothetical protein